MYVTALSPLQLLLLAVFAWQASSTLLGVRQQEQASGSTAHAGKKRAAPAVAGNASGTGSPLTEEGYSAVASLVDDDQMIAFIRRVVKSMHRKVVDTDSLKGFAPYYSGKEATQDLAHLRQELMSAPWVGAEKPPPPPKPAPQKKAPENPKTFKLVGKPAAKQTATTTTARPTQAAPKTTTTRPTQAPVTQAPAPETKREAKAIEMKSGASTTQPNLHPHILLTTAPPSSTQAPKATSNRSDMPEGKLKSAVTVGQSSDADTTTGELLDSEALVLSDVDLVLNGSFSRLSDFTSQTEAMQSAMAKNQEQIKEQLRSQRLQFISMLEAQQHENEELGRQNEVIRARIHGRKETVTSLRKSCRAMYHDNKLVRRTVQSMNSKLLNAAEYINEAVAQSAENLDAAPLKILVTTIAPTLDNLLDGAELNDTLGLAGLGDIPGHRKMSLLGQPGTDPLHMVQNMAGGVARYTAAAQEGGLKLKAYFLAAQEVENNRHAALIKAQAELNQTEDLMISHASQFFTAQKQLNETKNIFSEKLQGIQMFAKRAGEHIEKVLKAVGAHQQKSLQH